MIPFCTMHLTRPTVNHILVHITGTVILEEDMKERMRDKASIRVRMPEKAMNWIESQVERYNSSVQAEIVRAVVDKAEMDEAAKRSSQREAGKAA